MGKFSLPFRGDPPEREAWVLQQWSGFDPQRWKKSLGRMEWWPEELDACPVEGRWPRVTRQTVMGVGGRASEPLGAIHTYVAAAVWGAGTRARSVTREIRVVADNSEDPGERLSAAVRTMLGSGPLQAYRELHGRGNVIKGLGPSFGTKVLYFSGYDRVTGDQQPLIFDQYVAAALNQLCGLSLPDAQWTTKQYEDYLDVAHDWAHQWKTEPDVVERVLFSIGKASPLVVGVLSGHQQVGSQI